MNYLKETMKGDALAQAILGLSMKADNVREE